MAGKSDIVEHLANSLEGMTKKQSGEALDAFVGFITDTLQSGEKVQIPGFGTFQISDRKERQGRNPQTGEAITIPASKGVSFKAGKALKDAVNS